MAPKAKAAAAAPATAKAAPKAKPEAKPKPKPKAEQEEEAPKKPQPDRAAFEVECAKVQEAIDALQLEHGLIAKQILERSGGKEEFFRQKDELRGQLDEFSKKIEDLMSRKMDVNKGVQEKRQEGADMRQQLNKMKKSIGYTDEKEIDQRIADIEFKLVTDTITLKEEKELLKEIQELKRNRPKVSQVHKLEDSLEHRDTEKSHKELSTLNEEINVYRDGKRKVQEKLSVLLDGRQKQLGDLPLIIEQRDEINKKIQEKVKERNDLRDEFRQAEREFKQWQEEQRKARAEKIAEERAAKQKQWEQDQRFKKAEAMDEQPHVQEMTLIEQTILFCKNLTQSKDKEQKEEKKEIAHDNPEGTEVLVKKEDRDEFYYVPTAKKKGKSKVKGKEGASKPIKHNAETFRLFDQLKLDTPITTEDIPATLEKLDAQLDMYKQKVKEWEMCRDDLKRRILEGEEVVVERGQKVTTAAAGEDDAEGEAEAKGAEEEVEAAEETEEAPEEEEEKAEEEAAETKGEEEPDEAAEDADRGDEEEEKADEAEEEKKDE